MISLLPPVKPRDERLERLVRPSDAPYIIVRGKIWERREFSPAIPLTGTLPDDQCLRLLAFMQQEWYDRITGGRK